MQTKFEGHQENPQLSAITDLSDSAAEGKLKLNQRIVGD